MSEIMSSLRSFLVYLDWISGWVMLGAHTLSSKLVSVLFGIVLMFVPLPKDLVPECFITQICANSGAHAHFGADLRDEAIPNKIL